MGGARQVALEGVEAAGQLGPVGLEPFVELPEGLDAQAVEPALGVATNLDLMPPLPADADAAHILAEAHRIFAEDMADVPEVT